MPARSRSGGGGCALQHIEPDPAEPEDHDIIARLDLGSIEHRAHPGGHPAADVARGLEWRIIADFGDRDFRLDGEIRECAAALIVEDGLALVAESASAIGPWPCVARIAVHRLPLPERQVLHLPHSGV